MSKALQLVTMEFLVKIPFLVLRSSVYVRARKLIPQKRKQKLLKSLNKLVRRKRKIRSKKRTLPKLSMNQKQLNQK